MTEPSNHHKSVIDALKIINANVCVYTHKEGATEPAKMCDCKYGVTNETVGGYSEDGPGCPELRSTIRCIEAMDPEEFERLIAKPAGFFGSWDALDIERRKHKHTKDLLVEAYAKVSKMREALRDIETKVKPMIQDDPENMSLRDILTEARTGR